METKELTETEKKEADRISRYYKHTDYTWQTVERKINKKYNPIVAAYAISLYYL